MHRNGVPTAAGVILKATDSKTRERYMPREYKNAASLICLEVGNERRSISYTLARQSKQL